jgi:hypothetical protein
MEHIRQKLNLAARESQAYTVVITTDWTQPLSEHPSIVENPDIFEISNEPIPDNAQFLNYV